jgi:hypothetical protein
LGVGDSKIDVFWGTAAEFFCALKAGGWTRPLRPLSRGRKGRPEMMPERCAGKHLVTVMDIVAGCLMENPLTFTRLVCRTTGRPEVPAVYFPGPAETAAT